MSIRFFGIAHQTWHNDALHEICQDSRLPDILRWLADAGFVVALSRYRGHHTVILQSPAMKPGKAFRDTTWCSAAAQALLYATTNPLT
ncbi:hypothetical protein [Nonomuraea sp. LPB2021202275-12-8]|uniref:hypothetical protein n=1 Tax=Nonomuraea sp. LPB2021202275-12-8 TaxID=3120159 RepID=UPI00300D3BC9